MTTKPLSILVLALALAGCSKKDAEPTTNPEPTATTDGTKPAGEHQGEPAHEHHFEGAVESYHAVLSPLWHAEAGEQRTNDTCAAAADLVAKAGAIEAEPVPAAAGGKEDAWNANAAALTAASKELETVCAGNRATFDATFGKLHDSFHTLIEVAGEKH
jgi:hypothetical protein